MGYLWGGELHGDGSKFGYNPAPRGHDGVNLILEHRVAGGCGKAWDGQASFVVYSGFGQSLTVGNHLFAKQLDGLHDAFMGRPTGMGVAQPEQEIIRAGGFLMSILP